VIYVNPAFERAFGKSAEEACGESLALLFEGGGREAILGAVAEVCTRGETVSFRLREAGSAFLGLASPIEAEADRVGVVILLTDEPAADERLLAFQGEIAEPLDEALQAFEEILEQTGGRRSEKYRGLVERGMAAAERARKWSDELHAALCGRSAAADSGATLDPLKVVRDVTARLAVELEQAGVDLQLLAPAEVPAASGDAAMLETTLTRLIRHRLAAAESGSYITLSVRPAGEADQTGVLFSVIDLPAAREETGLEEDEQEQAVPEPRAVGATVAALRGRICTIEDPVAGRATSIRLETAPAA
jgi:PAS domain-containing protein